MSIEGAARVGYVNPDETTFAFLKGRAFAPQGTQFEAATKYWRSRASDPDARYDDHVVIDGDQLEPTVTWGINPGQSVGVTGTLPDPRAASKDDQAGIEEALQFMRPGVTASAATVLHKRMTPVSAPVMNRLPQS